MKAQGRTTSTSREPWMTACSTTLLGSRTTQWPRTPGFFLGLHPILLVMETLVTSQVPEEGWENDGDEPSPDARHRKWQERAFRNGSEALGASTSSSSASPSTSPASLQMPVHEPPPLSDTRPNTSGDEAPEKRTEAEDGAANMMQRNDLERGALPSALHGGLPQDTMGLWKTTAGQQLHASPGPCHRSQHRIRDTVDFLSAKIGCMVREGNVYDFQNTMRSVARESRGRFIYENVPPQNPTHTTCRTHSTAVNRRQGYYHSPDDMKVSTWWTDLT